MLSTFRAHEWRTALAAVVLYQCNMSGLSGMTPWFHLTESLAKASRTSRVSGSCAPFFLGMTFLASTLSKLRAFWIAARCSSLLARIPPSHRTFPATAKASIACSYASGRHVPLWSWLSIVFKCLQMEEMKLRGWQAVWDKLVCVLFKSKVIDKLLIS